MIHSGNGGKVRRIWRCSLERSGGLEVEWRLQGENEWDSLLCVMLESLFYQGQWVAKRSRGSSGISKDWAKEWSIKLCSAPESINAESEREEVFTASLAGIMRSSRGGLPFPHLSVPLPLLTSDISCRNGARINKWPPRLQCRHSLAARPPSVARRVRPICMGWILFRQFRSLCFQVTAGGEGNRARSMLGNWVE